MISPKNLEELKNEQRELDKLIYQQRTIDLEWNSLANAQRLKLNILIEIGEFANEIKTFKLWRNKKEIELAKAKEELIDCLCFFLGLCSIYKIEFSKYYSWKIPKRDLPFNDLLLNFFFQTNSLYIEESEVLYRKGSIELSDEQVSNYYKWLWVFNEISLKLEMDEIEILNVYKHKNEINKQRVIEGH